MLCFTLDAKGDGSKCFSEGLSKKEKGEIIKRENKRNKRDTVIRQQYSGGRDRKGELGRRKQGRRARFLS